MKTYINELSFKGLSCYEMHCDRYSALFCAELGANMLRFRNKTENFEILHFNENVNIEFLKDNILLFGIPTLYLPNRYYKGLLKTSDNIYKLPINEPAYDNFIHGFLHKRNFSISDIYCCDDFCRLTACYLYNSSDEFYKFFPVDFKAEITYTLSDNGLVYKFTLTNLSEKKLPILVGCHTSFNLPFAKNSDEKNLRLNVNVLDKSVINKNLVSTGEFVSLNEYDLQYKNGEINPLTTSIDNDMYRVEPVKKDDIDFYEVELTDKELGVGIRYEVGTEYGFWLFWNHWGNSGLFCAEPMTSLINAPNIDLSAEITGYSELSEGESWSGFQRIYDFSL